MLSGGPEFFSSEGDLQKFFSGGVTKNYNMHHFLMCIFYVFTSLINNSGGVQILLDMAFGVTYILKI